MAGGTGESEDLDDHYLRVFEMAQTEQPLTNWEVSRAMLGHQ